MNTSGRGLDECPEWVDSELCPKVGLAPGSGPTVTARDLLPVLPAILAPVGEPERH